MLKKEISSHLLVTIIWLVIVTLLRWQWHWNLLLLWLGGLLGTFLIDLDHLLYTLVIYPQEVTSLRVKNLLQQRHYKETLTLLIDTHDERLKLAFHNAPFQVVFWVLCFFVLSSTGSLLGSGLVMAMALHLLKDEWELLFQGKEEHLRQLLFWPVKKEISFNQQKTFLLLMIIVFLGLNFLLI
jgi:hypothetical protein